MIKVSVCCTLYFRNHMSYDLHLWYTCMYKRIISAGIFFFFLFFSKFWFSGSLGVVKRAKNDPKLQKNSACLTPYFRNCLSYDFDFAKLLCKMMVSPSNFFVFQKFDFWDCYGGKRAKNDLKLPVSVYFALYLRNCRLYHQGFENDVYRCFSLFLFFNLAL